MLATFCHRLLSQERCDHALAIVERLAHERAEVEGRTSKARQGQVAWVDRTAETDWLFGCLDRFARRAAERAGVSVDRLDEPLQAAIYGPGSTFDWHIDTGRRETRLRKMTVSLQLSSPAQYSGGNLDIIGHVRSPYWRLQGSAVAFASILGHRVTRVTQGTRIALVGWMEGPPYT